MYTLKEVTQILHMTEHTVRYYTDKGLIPNVQRDKNNNRLFDETSINWLTGVRFLKECGMSIESIKNYVDLCLEGDSSIQERYKIILEQKSIAEAQLKEAKKRVEYLENKAKHYLAIVNKVIPDDTNPGTWEEDSISKANVS